MANFDKRLCFKWNDFRENVSSAFGDLREDKEFTDVTLACEDGQQVEAHKVVLVASSPLFTNILKRNKHPHPLIYMRGLKSENVMAMVDFFYHGEANIDQENLDTFLALAEELQLKGLMGNETVNEEPIIPEIVQPRPQLKSPTSKLKLKQYPVANKMGVIKAANKKAVALSDHATNGTNMESLDQQVKTMMTISGVALPNGQGKARKCKVCGKEGSMAAIMNHIEANHIAEISIPCGVCGKSVTSRNALRIHNSREHKSQ